MITCLSQPKPAWRSTPPSSFCTVVLCLGLPGMELESIATHASGLPGLFPSGLPHLVLTHCLRCCASLFSHNFAFFFPYGQEIPRQISYRATSPNINLSPFGRSSIRYLGKPCSSTSRYPPEPGTNFNKISPRRHYLSTFATARKFAV